MTFKCTYYTTPIKYFGSITAVITDLVASAAMGTAQHFTTLSNAAHSSVLVLQVLWFWCPEERASLWRERLPRRVCSSTCPVSKLTIWGWTGAVKRPPLLLRYVEFPVRRCRNMAKPLVELQQGCNQGPCPELPRAFPGRTTSSAVVLGWYASPWQQVRLLQLWSARDFQRCERSPAERLPIRSFSPTREAPWWHLGCHHRHDENRSAKSYKEWFYVNCGPHTIHGCWKLDPRACNT